MIWDENRAIQYKRIIEKLKDTKLSKKETLTALKEVIKNRKEELDEWIMSGGEDATENEMLEHNFLVDIENGLNTLEINAQNDRQPLTEFSDTELLKEVETRIKAGGVKIDWLASSENYNEEDDIKGLFTDDYLLDLYEYYELFPSRKERHTQKPESWRITVMKEWNQEKKDMFNKNMKENKKLKDGNLTKFNN